MASGLLRHVSGTFAFHSSVESFLSQAGDSPGTSPLRTRLLNRNVAIVTAYAQVQAILGSSTATTAPNADDPVPYSAAQAYAAFMAPFSPGPNLLLSDGHAHAQLRDLWTQLMHRWPAAHIESTVERLVRDHFTELVGSTIDLYASMKQLAAKLLFGLFLDLEATDPVYAEVLTLQENLLRGQFSMLPVSIHLGLWRSPRKIGLDAMRRLQVVVARQLERTSQTIGNGSFAAAHDKSQMHGKDLEDMTNHLMLFTSSLAVKALASLMMALFLNVFILQRNGKTLATGLVPLPAKEQEDKLRKIELETERLSPPIIGIMRHVSTDQTIPSAESGGDSIHLPKGSDVWLYFVRAGRDKSIFGPDAVSFRPERFDEDSMHERKREPLAFSSGPKSCLGRDLSRTVCLSAAKTMLKLDIKFQGQIQDKGVQAWLGWREDVGPEDWEAGMRQLPVQHPRDPVMMQLVSRETE